MTTAALQDLPLSLARKDVLTLSGWSKDTYYAALRAGDLPVAHRTPGGQPRFNRDTILRLLGHLPAVRSS